MRKKVLLASLSIAVSLSMTACGGSKEEAPKESNMEQEVMQQTDDDFAEDGMAEAGESEGSGMYYNPEVCAMYYDYLTGGISEEELTELLGTISEDLTVDKAKEIFEESGEQYGYVICEPTPEILNASAGDPMIQVGDVVVQFPCTFGDFMEAVNGEFGDKDEASTSDRALGYYRKQYSLDTEFQKLDTLGNQGRALVKTPDGSFLLIGLGEDNKTIQSAKDLYVTRIITGSPNVFFPGGIRTGITMQELDEILEKSENEINVSQLSGGEWSSNEGRLYKYGSINNKLYFNFYVDAEKKQLWNIELAYEAPSSAE